MIDITGIYNTVYGEQPTGGWLRIWKEMSSEDKQKIEQVLLNVIAEGRAPLTNWRFVPVEKSRE